MTARTWRAPYPRRTELLEYVRGRTSADRRCSSSSERECRPGPPPRRSRAPLVARHRALESGGNPRALARAIGAALLDSAVAAVAREHAAHLVPDGVLYRVPFDAMVLADGRFAVQRFESARPGRGAWRSGAAAAPRMPPCRACSPWGTRSSRRVGAAGARRTGPPSQRRGASAASASGRKCGRWSGTRRGGGEGAGLAQETS